jgi:hypothetical protein
LIYHDPEPPFTFDELLHRYGPRRKRMIPTFMKVLAELIIEARSLALPTVVRKSWPASELSVLQRHLPGAEVINLGLCTLGPALEQRAAAFFPDNPLAGVVLDQIGTAWIDGLMRRLHQQLRVEAKARGWRAGPAYRPGIGRWPLEMQGELFRHLPGQDAGVTLSDEWMMSPKKSVSFVVAQGRRLGPCQFDFNPAVTNEPN